MNSTSFSPLSSSSRKQLLYHQPKTLHSTGHIPLSSLHEQDSSNLCAQGGAPQNHALTMGLKPSCLSLHSEGTGLLQPFARESAGNMQISALRLPPTDSVSEGRTWKWHFKQAPQKSLMLLELQNHWPQGCM